MSAMGDLYIRILDAIEAKELKIGDKVVIDGYEHMVSQDDVDFVNRNREQDFRDVIRGEGSAF